jgi:hypothetical protein
MSYNPIMVWLLYSPLHGILSRVTMVINYMGRKSGKAYRLPIGYLRIDDTLLTTSYKHRKWWRNLRGGVDVTLRLRGKDVSGSSEVIEDEQGVMEGIKAFLESDPRTTRMFGIKLGSSGQIDDESLRQVASKRVIVRTTLR